MSDSAQLTTIYATATPLLLWLFWLTRQRHTESIKWLSEYLHFLNNKSTFVLNYLRDQVK